MSVHALTVNELLLTALVVGVAAGALLHYAAALLKRFRYGRCELCERLVCRKTGPWWARRREAAYCGECWGDP